MRARLLLLTVLVAGCSTGSSTPPALPTVPSTSPTLAVTAPFAVAVTTDPHLPDHTVYLPQGVPYRVPLIAWGNGGCRTSNIEHRSFLRDLASRGYLVVANGARDAPFVSDETAVERPASLLAAVDAGLADFSDRVDPTRVVLMGQSCGAAEALTASRDPRVRATIAWNNGGDVSGLHAPVLYFSGGTGDETLQTTTAAYDATTVPTIHADDAAAGHIGPWHNPALQKVAVDVADRFLRLALDDDPGARTFLLGPGCGLCDAPGWTLRSKGWPTRPA